MITVLIGDIFKTECATLVNTVNCVGVMGKGIAEVFKNRFPDMYKDYTQKCKGGNVKPGEPYYYHDLFGTSIINFPTKDHWRSPSRISYIEKGLDWFIDNYKELEITSIAFPPLGCGNGGLDWRDVGPVIYGKLKDLEITIELYAPYGTKKEQMSEEFLANPRCKQPADKGKKGLVFKDEWVAILETLFQLDSNPYALYVGRVVFQKICFILTELGVDTGFSFMKSSYGPFSQDVNKAITVFANNNLIVEQRFGQMIRLKMSKEYIDFSKHYSIYIEKYRTEIDKTIDLFSRIKNTNQAEVIATVFFASNALKSKGTPADEKEIYDYIVKWKKMWNDKKKEEELSNSIRDLASMGFIDVKLNEFLPYIDNIC